MAISKIENNSLASGVPGKANLPAGTVLQVVNATYDTEFNTSSATYADTGLTATITPTSASSKFLIIVDQTGLSGSAIDVRLQLGLFRGSSEIVRFERNAGYATARSRVGGSGVSFLDSPATTSPVTYKTQGLKFSSGAGAASAQMDSSASTITLMEIAA